MKRLKSPDNTDLPFFAYGVFKPGQVGYSSINEFIINRDNLQVSEINLSLKQRNGMPMLVEDFTNNTKGYLYYFNDSKAYDIISNSRSRDLFEWKVYEIDGLESNVLIAKDCQFGDDYNYGSDSYDGKNDIGFFPVLNYVRDNLPNHNFGSFERFFELQKNYMLLWAVIDNYLSLKYGGQNQRKNVIKLSKQDSFKNSLLNNVNRIDTVNSSIDSHSYELNPNNSEESALYYYKIRCNVVHGGKESLQDTEKLYDATCELEKIMRDVLEDIFREYDDYY